MIKNQSPFSFFNKSLIIKSKYPIILVLIAGLSDLLTSIIGTEYLNLIEVNYINVNYYFIGILFWVSLFIFYIYSINYIIYRKESLKYEDSKKEKKRIETIKFLKLYNYLIPTVSFVIPIYNFILILGVIV